MKIIISSEAGKTEGKKDATNNSNLNKEQNGGRINTYSTDDIRNRQNGGTSGNRIDDGNTPSLAEGAGKIPDGNL